MIKKKEKNILVRLVRDGTRKLREFTNCGCWDMNTSSPQSQHKLLSLDYKHIYYNL